MTVGNLLGVFIVIMLSTMACSLPLKSERYRYLLSDPELVPFSAMYEVNREKFCLTNIDKDAEVEIERHESATSGYDVMLHIYSGNVSRTVAFERKKGKYIWIGEQEIHQSGRKFDTGVDGESYESISITYHEKEIGGYKGLNIRYLGDYKNVKFSNSDLICEDVMPYIQEWDKTKEKTKPAVIP